MYRSDATPAVILINILSILLRLMAQRQNCTSRSVVSFSLELFKGLLKEEGSRCQAVQENSFEVVEGNHRSRQKVLDSVENRNYNDS